MVTGEKNRDAGAAEAGRSIGRAADGKNSQGGESAFGDLHAIFMSC